MMSAVFKNNLKNLAAIEEKVNMSQMHVMDMLVP